MVEDSWPRDAEGSQLYLQCHVQVHSIPKNSIRCVLNGQQGQCTRYDHHANRIFVKFQTTETIKQELLALSPGNLRLREKTQEEHQGHHHQHRAHLSNEEPRADDEVHNKREFPEDSRGTCLYPGALVCIHGLRGKRIRLNGKEGICEKWDGDKQLMDVRLYSEGRTESIGNNHLRKVHPAEHYAKSAELRKVRDAFQQFDRNGDGMLDVAEFEHMLAALGIACLGGPLFKAMDKNGDNQITHEEFLEWALSPIAAGSGRKNSDVYLAEKRMRKMKCEDVDPLSETQQVEDVHERGGEHMGEWSLEHVKNICKGSLPKGWPKHGLTLLHNMHKQFPDVPVESVVSMMVSHDFVGGNVAAAIRKTGAVQDGQLPKLPGEFPAFYLVQCLEGLCIFKEGECTWSFKNMRDQKAKPAGTVACGDELQVLEVRRWKDHGFCFGLIRWPPGKTGATYWVDLGLETGAGLRARRHPEFTNAVYVRSVKPNARRQRKPVVDACLLPPLFHKQSMSATISSLPSATRHYQQPVAHRFAPPQPSYHPPMHATTSNLHFAPLQQHNHQPMRATTNSLQLAPLQQHKRQHQPPPPLPPFPFSLS